MIRFAFPILQGDGGNICPLRDTATEGSGEWLRSGAPSSVFTCEEKEKNRAQNEN
jgi:hypothetical protein